MTAPRVLRLADVREDVGAVQLNPTPSHPDGRVVPVQPFTQRMFALHAAIEAAADGPDADAQTAALVRLCIPEATDDERGDLTPSQVFAVVLQARGKLDLVLRALDAERNRGAPEGNAAAPAGKGKPRRRSTSRTGSSTPSPA